MLKLITRLTKILMVFTLSFNSWSTLPIYALTIDAIDDSYEVAENTSISVAANKGVLDNDIGSGLTVSLDTDVVNGSLTLNSNGSFVYTPNSNWYGTDTFTYSLTDGTDTDTATVTLEVIADQFEMHFDVDGSANNGQGNGGDEEIIVTIPVDEWNTFWATYEEDDNADAIVAYYNANGYTIVPATIDGFVFDHWFVESIEYENANQGGAVKFVRITAYFRSNVAPVAVGDEYSTDEDTPLTIVAPGVLGNDTDSDGDSMNAVLDTQALHGVVALNADGSFVYIPVPNYFGPDSFTYFANDGFVGYDSETVTVDITVNPINDAPVAVDDSYSVDKNGSLTIVPNGVLANDTDIENDSLSASLNTDVSNGTLTLNSDGSFTYVPTTDYVGPDSFTYFANDSTDDSILFATVNITVSNTAPIADAQNLETPEDTALAITLSGSDPNGDDLTFITGTPAHGSLSGSGANITYTPDLDYVGTDSFTFTTSDGDLTSTPATISITVTPVNDAPVAINDSFSTDEETLLTIPAGGVLANDSDVDGDPLSAVLVTDVNFGTLTLNLDGSFTYLPDVDFTGIDTFTYVANDTLLNSNTVTVTITVNPVNDAPVAVNNSYTTAEDTELNVPIEQSVLLNDYDIDGDAIEVVETSITTNLGGSVVMNTNGSFNYTPALNFNGLDSFDYTITDGLLTDTATVTINVTPVNDAPVAADDSYTVSQNGTLNVPVDGVLDNDSDIDGDTLTSSLVSNVTDGTLILGIDGSFTYTPDTNFNGTDSFTYVANDGNLDSNTATVTINVTEVNQAPVADDQTLDTDEDTPLDIILTGSDFEGSNLSFSIVSNPTNGTLSGTGENITYTPAADYHGSDSFTFRVYDGELYSEVANISITVNSINDAPVAEDNAFSTDEDTILVVPVEQSILLNDSDPDGDAIEVVETSITTNLGGSVVMNTNGSFNYTPALNFNGLDSFDYTITDGLLTDTATVTITINSINDAPTADSQELTTPEDTPLAITLTGDDVDGDLITYFPSNPTNGVLSGTGTEITYTPNTNFVGTDSFTFVTNDGTVDSDPATITIEVTPVNDTPTAEGQELTTPEDTALDVTLDGDDIESATLIYATTTPTNGVLSGTGSAITYTPNANFVGSDSFTFTVEDEEGLVSDPATITIEVTPVNDAPVAVANTYTVVGNTTLTVAAAGILANDTDVEADPLTSVLNVNVVNGVLVLAANGGFSYTPTTGFVGTDTFTYHANDGELDSNVVTVTITVTAPPAPPVTPPTTPPTTPPVTVTVTPTPTPLAALNTAPVANDGNISTEYETVISGQANASDADGDALTFSLTSDVSNGTLTFNEDGSFTYTPNTGFVGSDSFSFIANDGELDSNTANVVISVTQGVIEVEEPEETPLAALPMDFSWLYWLLGLLPLLLAFIRPNIKYTLKTKDGTEKTLRRRLSKPDDDQTVYIVELNDKDLIDITTIDVTIYKRLAKHLGNLTVNFVLRGHLVHSVVIPADYDEEYNTMIQL